MFLSNGQVIPAGVADRLGDRTPIFADANYYAATAMPLLNTYAAYAAIYKSQLWVRTVVSKLAKSTARMPFEVKGRVNDTDSINENGPLQDLLARPNRHMSGYHLWEWTSSTFDVYGEAFWLKLRDDSGRVRELQPMHPTNVIVHLQADGSYGYVYSNGTVNTSQLPVMPEEDVVAFTSYNPDNLKRGLSTLEALRMTLLNEDAARRATASMWTNGARPGMILTTANSLSEGATSRIKAQFNASMQGADRFGSTVVFEEGITPHVVQLSAEEMQYIESRKLNREEVCAAFDVPQPVVGILDHATFSNITEQLRSMYRDTMAPRFVNFESVIDHQLVPDFYGSGRVFTRFNMEEVLRGDFEVKATATVAMRNAGAVSGNEMRGMFGLPRSDDPNMDRIFANAALVPLGTPAERITITEGAPADPNQQAEAQGVIDAGQQAAADAAQRALPAKPSARALMGRLARQKEAGATVKTWRAACAFHVDLDGERQPIDGVFTNGFRVPGDDDETCGCTVTFEQE